MSHDAERFACGMVGGPLVTRWVCSGLWHTNVGSAPCNSGSDLDCDTGTGGKSFSPIHAP
eukprot:365123-Chlamydomonas_euryale.AAC.46